MFEDKIKEELQGERIVLRRFKEKDIEAIYRFGSDKVANAHLLWEGVSTIAEARTVFENYYTVTKGVYAIALKASDECIGSFAFTIKEEHEKADFEYVIERSYWNQGYTSEALYLVLSHCFHDIGLQRVESKHNKENLASGRVMQKCGMRYEGIARREEKVKGKFVDNVHYGILKEDFIVYSNLYANRKPAK